MTEINFSNAELKWIDLSKKDLRGANFSDADLSHTNLSGSNLENANFRDAKLIGTDLSKAKNIQKAKNIFNSENLSEINLSELDFSGLCIDLSGKSLKMQFSKKLIFLRRPVQGNSLSGESLWS